MRAGREQGSALGHVTESSESPAGWASALLSAEGMLELASLVLAIAESHRMREQKVFAGNTASSGPLEVWRIFMRHKTSWSGQIHSPHFRD